MARCPFCGAQLDLVPVHGHAQCARCGTNVQPCCAGASAGDEADEPVRSELGVEPQLFARLFLHLGGPTATVTADSLLFALVQHLGSDLDDARVVLEAGERVGVVMPAGPGRYRLRGVD